MKFVKQEQEEDLYILQTPGSKIYLIVGDKSAIVFDLGKKELDLDAEVRAVTDLPYIAMISHGDSDHIACIHRYSRVYAHPDEIYRLPEGPEYVPVQDGQKFDLGGAVIEVIHTPGHTEGSICLLNKNRGYLLTGDTISNVNVHMTRDNTDLGIYLASVKHLKERSSEFSRLYPAHKEYPLDNEILDQYITLTEQLIAGTAQPVPMPEGVSNHMRPDELVGVLYYAYKSAGILIK